MGINMSLVLCPAAQLHGDVYCSISSADSDLYFSQAQESTEKKVIVMSDED